MAAVFEAHAARAEVAADLDAAAASAERNRDSSGFGWTAVHVIAPPATSYVEAGLLVADAGAVLDSIMPRVTRFYTTVLSAAGRAERDPSGLEGQIPIVAAGSNRPRRRGTGGRACDPP